MLQESEAFHQFVLRRVIVRLVLSINFLHDVFELLITGYPNILLLLINGEDLLNEVIC